MRFSFLLLAAGSSLAVPAFAAERIAVEVGQGAHWSKGADAVFLHYRGEHTIPSFPEMPAFYEWSLGTWKGKHDNSALGLSIGTQWFIGDFHVDVSGGVAAVAHKTRLTGTHQQFILRVGAGYQIDRFDVGVYQVHYSNAKSIFEWNGYNVGYDFLSLQFSYALR